MFAVLTKGFAQTFSLPPVRDYLRTAAWDRRLTTVEGERDWTAMCFSCKIRAESDGVRLSENLTEYIPHRKLKWTSPLKDCANNSYRDSIYLKNNKYT